MGQGQGGHKRKHIERIFLLWCECSSACEVLGQQIALACVFMEARKTTVNSSGCEVFECDAPDATSEKFMCTFPYPYMRPDCTVLLDDKQITMKD